MYNDAFDVGRELHYMNHELYTIHQFISEEDGKCFFDYQWVDEESIEILKSP